MEVHRQTCQNCGSREHNLALVREPGHGQVVFVRCARCHELVARYGLASYYHHGKGMESYLRSVAGSMESGRRTLADFDAARHDAVEGFERVMTALRERGKQF